MRTLVSYLGIIPSSFRIRTIALDGDGCDIGTLLDGSGRSGRDRCGEGASDGSNGDGLHGDGACVSDGISSLVEVVREELFVIKDETAEKRQTVKGSSKREYTPGRKVQLEGCKEEVAHEKQ